MYSFMKSDDNTTEVNDNVEVNDKNYSLKEGGVEKDRGFNSDFFNDCKFEKTESEDETQIDEKIKYDFSDCLFGNEQKTDSLDYSVDNRPLSVKIYVGENYKESNVDYGVRETDVKQIDNEPESDNVEHNPNIYDNRENEPVYEEYGNLSDLEEVNNDILIKNPYGGLYETISEEELVGASSIDIMRENNALIEEYEGRIERSESEEEKEILQDNIDNIKEQNVNIKEYIESGGVEAIKRSEGCIDSGKINHEMFDNAYYDEKPDFNELSELLERNESAISELQKAKDDLDMAKDMKMQEMRDYIFEHKYKSSYESMQDENYRRLVNEYNELSDRSHTVGYHIVNLTEDNLLIDQMTSENDDVNNKKLGLGGFFDALFGKNDLNSEGTMNDSIDGLANLSDLEEKQEGYDEIDDGIHTFNEYYIEKYDELKNKDVDELSEDELNDVMSIIENNLRNNYSEDFSVERFDRLTQTISFVDNEKVQMDCCTSEPERIEGYYLYSTDSIYLNRETNGSVTELLATADHEALHLLTADIEHGERLSEPVEEGLTELYSIRDTAEITDDYESMAYNQQVEVMYELEKAFGKNELWDMYKTKDYSSLNLKYDLYMGDGAYDKLNDSLNRMHKCYKEGNYHYAEYYKKSIIQEIKEFNNRVKK